MNLKLIVRISLGSLAAGAVALPVYFATQLPRGEERYFLSRLNQIKERDRTIRHPIDCEIAEKELERLIHKDVRVTLNDPAHAERVILLVARLWQESAPAVEARELLASQNSEIALRGAEIFGSLFTCPLLGGFDAVKALANATGKTGSRKDLRGKVLVQVFD